MEHITLTIEGLSCANCALKVEKELNKQEGIQNAEIDFARGSVSLVLKEGIKFDETKRIELQNALSKIEAVQLHSKRQDVEKHNAKLTVQEWMLIASAVLVLASFFITYKPFEYFLMVVYFPIAYPVLRQAINNLRNGEWFDETFLMGIATLGAMLIGDGAEALGVMVFYRVGETLQDRAVDQARKTIEATLKAVPQSAMVLRGKKVSEVDPKNVFLGDTLVILPGAMVPLDGIVIEGNSSIDTSSITGESAPVFITIGSEIASGSFNQQGRFLLKVTKKAGDSTLQKMIAYVQEAASKKAPMEKFITKFAKVYTPIVVGLAVITAIVVGSVTGDWITGIHRALIFLVISCPCALVISIPLGFYAALGKASSLGILVKGGVALQKLAEVDEVLIDKTGTLTQGKFRVEQVLVNSIDAESLLEIAAHAEASSTHPLAQAVLNAYGQEIDVSRITRMEEMPGYGLNVDFDGQTYYLGNDRLASFRNIKVPEDLADQTVIHVLSEKHYLGTILLQDQIKEESTEAIRRLHQDGLKIRMVSGDRKSVAAAVSDQLKLDSYDAECRPEDKVAKIEERKAQNRKVAFVGDGMNDAAALAAADVSLAMGARGSDVAAEAADVVLTHDNPLAISDAVRLSKRTMVVLKQNLFFVFAIKIAILVLGSLGYASMWLAVFADVGVAILAILNAMRVVNGGNYALDGH